MVVLAALVVGCTGVGDGGDEQPAAQTTPDGGESQEGADEESSATFVYGVPVVAEALGTHNWDGDATKFIHQEMLGTLFAYDSSNMAGMGCEELPTITDVRGELVEDWEVSEDYRTIRVKLRDTKSEFGNQLTSQDVEWTIAHIAAHNRVMHGHLKDTLGLTEPIEEAIEIIDEDEFSLELKEGAYGVAALPVLTIFFGQILDSTEATAHATDDDPYAASWLNNNTASFGPWGLESFEPGNEVVLKANEGYYGDRGNVSRLIIQAVPDASTRVQLLEAGNITLAAKLDYDSYARLQDQSGIDVVECESANRETLVLNHKDPKFQDPIVRQAISMAIDREALVAGAHRGLARPAEYGLHGTYLDLLDDDTIANDLEMYRYDPEGAVALLAEAGVDNLEFTLRFGTASPGPHAETMAVAIRDNLSDIGVTVELERVGSGAEFSESYQQGRYEAVLYNEAPAIADPFYSAFAFHRVGSATNSYGYDSAEYAAVMEQLREPDVDRTQSIVEIANLNVQDNPVIYLVDNTHLLAWKAGISGYQHNGYLPVDVVNLNVPQG